ncbi:hypothetical protein B0H11DRAFT_2364246 [Mycena galericulata]|nr:hypothetical protein B0H11DRAFT_2364246 [Mycena galericulata]
MLETLDNAWELGLGMQEAWDLERRENPGRGGELELELQMVEALRLGASWVQGRPRQRTGGRQKSQSRRGRASERPRKQRKGGRREGGKKRTEAEDMGEEGKRRRDHAINLPTHVVNAHGPRTCIFFLDLSRLAASSARSHVLLDRLDKMLSHAFVDILSTNSWAQAALLVFDFNTPALRHVRASGVAERTPARADFCLGGTRTCSPSSVSCFFLAWVRCFAFEAQNPPSPSPQAPGAARGGRAAAAVRVHRAGHDVLPPPLACLGGIGIELVQAAHAPAGGA